MRIPYRRPGKFSQIKQDPLMTENKLNELKNKLEKLKNFSRPEAAKEVSRLAELGDFSENAEYQLAKGRLRGINNTILKIEQQLKEAIIIKPQNNNEVIQLGHTVTMENSVGQKKTYLILGSTETNPQKGIISYQSPLGAALMGHKIGDTITVNLLNNETNYKVLKIE